MQPGLAEIIRQREEVLSEVKKLLISSLQLDQSEQDLDPETPLFGTGLGLDSVDAVVVVVEIEERFGFYLSEEESMPALRTINSLVDLVLNKKSDES